MGTMGSERIGLRRMPKQERSVQRLENILAAASELIERKGVANLKMTEIAQSAGVPVGSIYQYFPEKAAVLKALFDRMTEGFRHKMIESFSGINSMDDALDRLCGIVDWYYEDLRSHPASLQIWLGTETDTDLVRLNVEDSRLIGEMLCRAVKPFLPPHQAIDADARAFLVAYLIGSAVRLAVISDETIAPRILDEWKTMIRNAGFSPQA